ncbi:MAG: HTTM domain-containing protein [Actinobacteria bacterium]|nr:HTTM domain-containing protein [Actinomycetota bacterium]
MLSALMVPVRPDTLRITRMVVGAAAFVRAWVALPVLLRLAEPEVLRMPLFDWMPDPTPALAWTLVSLWAASALLVTVGWRLGVTAPCLVGCLAVMLALDRQTYSNHLYLMAWMVLLLAVAAGGARIGRVVPRWTLLLLMLQVSIVYFFSGISKINDDFLSGLALAGVLDRGLISLPGVLARRDVLVTVAILTIVVEVFLAFALWLPRYRKPAIALGVALHLAIVTLLADTVELAVFSALMLSTYPLFIHTPVGEPGPKLS